ncbi:MAG: N-acetylmuramoyl-L-alanine amidase, partial [Longimicrobiales bacterium]|nr:N-acetylmuramoyl-L-alanine amidase [Longimicrobiales bacterium]
MSILPRGRLGHGAAGAAVAALALLLLTAFAAPRQASGQSLGALRLSGPTGDAVSVPVADHRGYAAISGTALESLGWEIDTGGSTVVARLGEDALVELRPGSPFFSWDGELFQLVEAPYFFGERLYVPLQLVTGFLPRHLDDVYAFDEEVREIRALRAERWTPEGPGGGSPSGRSARSGGGRGAGTPGGAAPSSGSDEAAGVVVVIDPGHGGRDSGALGPAGIVEKDVALGVARALAEELGDEPGMEVRLTRDGDELVPLWQRGERATRWKGDRPGIFLSLHANAARRGSSARGFETYFLSEARTDHERRVAALENSAMEMEEASDADPSSQNPDLGFILSDLRNRDHQRWSSLLAELVQDELDPVHPGPNRGVKQGPFAVITNALMPSVLVELGFITHRDEARTLADPSFQRQVAGSLAQAVRG